MLAAWIAKGAEIGTTAFFSILVFLLCLGIECGIIALIGCLISAGDKDKF